MEYKTTYTTSAGEEINLGDIIQGLQSHKVIVLWDKNKKDYIVELVDNELQKRFEYRESLKRFLEAWPGSIEKVGNILER